MENEKIISGDCTVECCKYIDELKPYSSYSIHSDHGRLSYKENDFLTEHEKVMKKNNIAWEPIG